MGQLEDFGHFLRLVKPSVHQKNHTRTVIVWHIVAGSGEEITMDASVILDDKLPPFLKRSH